MKTKKSPYEKPGLQLIILSVARIVCQSQTSSTATLDSWNVEEID